MKLSPAQIQEFGDKGYLFFPDLFSASETAVLKAEVPAIFAQRRQENDEAANERAHERNRPPPDIGHTPVRRPWSEA